MTHFLICKFLQGRFAPVALSACFDCTPGGSTNGVSSGATECTSCNSGFFSEGLAINCTECPAGRSSGNAAPDCVRCVPGTYSQRAASSICTACSAGKFSSSPGRTNCTACPGGTSQPATSQTSCSLCDEGRFAANEGELVCSPCLAATSAPSGSSGCPLAADGYYLDPRSSESTLCPDNMVCTGDYALPRPRRGFWVDRKLVEFASKPFICPRETCIGASTQKNTSKCWLAQAYVNGSSLRTVDAERGTTLCGSTDLLCRLGSRGPLCAS